MILCWTKFVRIQNKDKQFWQHERKTISPTPIPPTKKFLMHCAIIIRLKFNLIWNYTQTLPHKSNYGVLKITFFAHHRKGFEKQGCASPEFRGNIKCSKNEAMKNYNLFFLKHNLWNVIKLIDWMDAEAVVHTDIAKYASKNRRWKWRKQKFDAWESFAFQIAK